MPFSFFFTSLYKEPLSCDALTLIIKSFEFWIDLEIVCFLSEKIVSTKIFRNLSVLDKEGLYQDYNLIESKAEIKAFFIVLFKG